MKSKSARTNRLATTAVVLRAVAPAVLVAALSVPARATTVDFGGSLAGFVMVTGGSSNQTQSISNGTGTQTISAGIPGALISWNESGNNVQPVASNVPVSGTFSFNFSDGSIS